MKSKLITISAISSALIAIILTLGVYLSIADLFCLVISSVFVMLPLYYKSFLASFLCYLVGGVIAFVFSGFNFFIVVIPAYLGFFGIYPIIKNLLEQKKANKYIRYFLGLVWCVLVVFAMYFFYIEIMEMTFGDLPEFISNNILFFVGILGVVFYAVYERYLTTLKRIIDIYLVKLLK